MLNVLYYPDKNFNLQTHFTQGNVTRSLAPAGTRERVTLPCFTLYLNLNYEKNFTMNFAVCEHCQMNKTKK